MSDDPKQTSRAHDGDEIPSKPAYVPPCIEEDLPLEVQSLACSGATAKTGAMLPCGNLGS